MSEVRKTSFTDAVRQGHREGLLNNQRSHIIGLGVDYENGADGTTSGLASEFPGKLHDTPVSEAAFTGMAVGMATCGDTAIVHHGRVEFALLAMDQVLTQAAKWEFMFGGDYPCRFAARINIGRQWGNGPQHTSSYSSLFLNTPGLDIFWPSRPREAFEFTRRLHEVSSPTICMEHRYLFKTTDTLDAIDLNVPRLKAAIYGSDHPDIVILTYGDGVGEALRVLKHCADLAIQVVALTSFPIDLSECTDVVNSLLICEQIIVIDTAHYEFGVMEAIVGRLAVKINISGRVKVFSPAFEPCATSPQLVKDYYPQAPRITDWLVSQNLTKLCMPSYDFDKLHLPFDFDFSEIRPINEVR